MDEENQATLLLLQRLIKAQPDAPSALIADVLAQYSDAVQKDIRPAAMPELLRNEDAEKPDKDV